MKIKNLHVYGSKSKVDYLEEEYRWAGRNPVRRLGDGHLVVYALPLKKQPKKKPVEEVEEVVEKPRRHAKGYNDKKNARAKDA